MNRVIWKYPLGYGITHLALGKTAKPVHVDMDGVFQRCVWVEVDPEDIPSAPDYEFRTMATGEYFSSRPGQEYVGTVVTKDGFVWHVLWCRL